MGEDFFCISVNIRFVRSERQRVGLNAHLSREMNHGARSLLLKRCDTQFSVFDRCLREGENSNAHYQN